MKNKITLPSTIREKDGKVFTNYFCYEVVEQSNNHIIIKETCLVAPHKDKEPNYIIEKQGDFTLVEWVENNGCWYL